MDRFVRSLRICHIEFNEEAILMVVEGKILGVLGSFWILSDFREMSFCGPCGHFLHKITKHEFKEMDGGGVCPMSLSIRLIPTAS